MRLAIPLFLVLSTLLVGACATAPSAPDSGDIFELRHASDGQVYRMDRRTGRTVVLTGGVFKDIPEPGMTQLVIGRVYRAEDGKGSYRYNGQGKLELWGLDRYFISDSPK